MAPFESSVKSATLDKLLLGKQGKRWDGVPVPNVSVKDLVPQFLSHFRKRATQSKRMLVADPRRNGPGTD